MLVLLVLPDLLVVLVQRDQLVLLVVLVQRDQLVLLVVLGLPVLLDLQDPQAE